MPHLILENKNLILFLNLKFNFMNDITSVPLKFEISIFDTDYKCIIVVSKVNGLEFILCTSFLNLKIHVLQSIENQ